MPFPPTTSDLMASAMGNVLLASNSPSLNGTASNATSTSASSPMASKFKNNTSTTANGTMRIFYSLKENPNAIISYADLVRQEQKRQRLVQLQAETAASSKNGGNAGNPHPTSSSTSGPLKNQKVTGTGAPGIQSSNSNASATTSSSNAKDADAAAQSSSAAMDIDPPDGDEAIGEGDSEAEDDDEADEDEDDNEEDAEAEDEDDDEDPEEEDDDDDDPESGRREPTGFLEALTAKYVGLEENGNEGEDEDEDEDEDGKGQVYKRPSRWDTEHYDIEDEFIDDSEMMLEAIGMVRPKIDGFFAYRGPVETMTEDPDSSDAGPRSRKPAKKKAAAGSSPLNTSKGGGSKSNKGSNLAVMETANDSTSEMSEMDDKPKTSKPSTATSGLAISSTSNNDTAAVSGTSEPGSSSTPTKKKTSPSKSKVAKEIAKEGADANKDSDKESKVGANKKSKAKSTKATAATPTTSTPIPTPIVRIDSPPPNDDHVEHTTPPSQAPSSRAASPSKAKPKSRTPPAAEPVSATADSTSGSDDKAPTTATPEPTTAANTTLKPENRSTAGTSEAFVKSKGLKTIEPLNDEVKTAFDIVAALAKQETWEVKTRFPPHIKAPLFECARIALTTRSSGYVLDESFFTHLQMVLPYNKFTLKKLIYKNILPGWLADLEVQKTKLIDQFTTRANMVWKASGLEQDANQPERDGDGDVNMNGDDGKPQRKFPWSQDLRLLLWETMEKFMEILAAKQEYRAIDDSQPTPPSDSKTRKDAYQTLLLSFPTGWMTSYEISRQYSQLKEKVQKQEKREGESSTTAVPIGKAKPIFTNVPTPKSGAITGAPARSSASQSSALSTAEMTAVPVPAATSPSKSANTLESPSASIPVPGTNEGASRSSPSMSPSAVHRTAHLSEIMNPPSQQPRTQQDSFPSGAATKKRKIIEPHGTGSSVDPVLIAEPLSEGKDSVIPAHLYAHKSGGGGVS
ncbi:hypothetical protein BG011_001249, partial [Mortierella polycephala]